MGISRKVGVSQIAPLFSGLFEVFMSVSASYWLFVKTNYFIGRLSTMPKNSL
jgi:hypothetical protein